MQVLARGSGARAVREGGGQGRLASRGGLIGCSTERRRKYTCRDGEGGMGVAGLGTMKHSLMVRVFCRGHDVPVHTAAVMKDLVPYELV